MLPGSADDSSGRTEEPLLGTAKGSTSPNVGEYLLAQSGRTIVAHSIRCCETGKDKKSIVRILYFYQILALKFNIHTTLAECVFSAWPFPRQLTMTA